MFQFTRPETQITSISRFYTGGTYRPANMCSINSNLVMHVHHRENKNYETLVCDETGQMLKKWQPCHMLPTMTAWQIHGKDYLLEGCITCEVIRGYEFPHTESKVLCTHISPRVMCKGPKGTLLVFEEVRKSIKRLRSFGGKLHDTKQFSAEIEDVRGMCFSDKLNLAVLLHDNGKTITGINFVTEEVAWQHTDIQFGSSLKSPDLCDILMLPDGRLFVFTCKASFAIDPMDGSVLHKLIDLKDPGLIWTITTCQSGREQKIAIAHEIDTHISMFKIPFQPPETYRYLPKREILSNEEIMEIDD